MDKLTYMERHILIMKDKLVTFECSLFYKPIYNIGKNSVKFISIQYTLSI